MNSIKAISVCCLLIGALTPFAGCARPNASTARDASRNYLASTDKTVDEMYRRQIRSLAVSGPGQASLVVDRTRDLQLTTDGGQTWTIVPRQAVGDAFECVTMADGYRGWAVNHQGQVFTSKSSGTSWTQIAEPKNSRGDGLLACNQIAFVNKTDGWILEGLSIWRTTDGGVTWQEKISVLTPGVEGTPTSIYPIDVNALAVAGSNGQMYLTIDGGDSWKIKTLVPDNAAFTDVWFVDKQRGWLSGYVGEPGFRGLLFTTKDGGATWEELPFAEKEINPRSICFVGDEGWLAGHRRLKNTDPPLGLEGVLLHTLDGGKHWTPAQIGSEEPFFSLVRFTDQHHGWLAGRDNLYNTQDGGKTWQRVLSLPPVQ